MNIETNQMTPLTHIPSEDELNSAKRIYTGLLLVCKNLSLYPVGHSICINSTRQFHGRLLGFIKKYGNLKLEIERERIIAMGEAISSGLSDEGTLHFTLFRDGIRWIELMDGIGEDEINEILLILNKYMKLSAEPEGDIVTAFWEAQFPHLRYEVSEFSWGGDLEPGKGMSDLLNGKSMDLLSSRERDLSVTQPVEDPPIEEASLEVSQEEQILLQEMIKEEEKTDPTSYLDALLDSLLQHREMENLSIILDVLLEEFRGSLIRKDFCVPLRILQGLHYVLEISKVEMPWAVPSIEEFILNASGNDSLEPLKEIWNNIPSDDAETLQKIFKLLRPKAIQMLVLFLKKAQTEPLRRALLDSITFLASLDMSVLESILNSAEEGLIEKLVPIIINMDGKRSLKYLLKLSNHPSARVRHEAVKAICSRNPAGVKEIFSLIDDKDDAIRQMVLRQLGQSRDDAVEALLLSYLQKKKFSNNDGGHIIQCFRTLGKSGSLRSIPYLRETFLNRGWMPGFWRRSYRRGAAIALSELGMPEAEQLLEQARRSWYPALRGILKSIGQEL
jgi:hypothetical protein